MPKRVQSPSSINTFKQCPRKYYYQYIKRLETLPNIHLVRGSVVHSVLEEFFKLDVDALPKQGYVSLLEGLIKDFLSRNWTKSADLLGKIHMTEAQKLFYYEETEQMLMLWLREFLHKLSKEKLTFHEAFKKWKPRTEQMYVSQIHAVKGIIDAIHEFDNDIVVMDYKTSNKDSITPEYKLQLAIYALLYHEKHGKIPTRAGINFLKYGERYIDVDQELIDFARLEVQLVHEHTLTDAMEDYPKKESPLCKYSSGQCDFYNECFKNR